MEELLRGELLELETTLKKVRADLRRSQQFVREVDAGNPGATALRMEESIVRGLQRELEESQTQQEAKIRLEMKESQAQYQAELRAERSALKALQREHEASTERTVQQEVRQRVDMKDALQRAENAAVRGLLRRQDSVERGSLQLTDPLMEEAKALRIDIAQEQQMARSLTTKLHTLEETVASCRKEEGSLRLTDAEQVVKDEEMSSRESLSKLCNLKRLERDRLSPLTIRLAVSILTGGI